MASFLVFYNCYSILKFLLTYITINLQLWKYTPLWLFCFKFPIELLLISKEHLENTTNDIQSLIQHEFYSWPLHFGHYCVNGWESLQTTFRTLLCGCSNMARIQFPVDQMMLCLVFPKLPYCWSTLSHIVQFASSFDNIRFFGNLTLQLSFALSMVRKGYKKTKSDIMAFFYHKVFRINIIFHSWPCTVLQITYVLVLMIMHSRTLRSTLADIQLFLLIL